MIHLRFCVVGLTLTLAACSKGLSGEYTDDSGMFRYNFVSSRKVQTTVKVMGVETTQELDYELADGKLKLGPRGGPQQVFSIDDRGCIDGGMLAGKLCRKNG